MINDFEIYVMYIFSSVYNNIVFNLENLGGVCSRLNCWDLLIYEYFLIYIWFSKVYIFFKIEYLYM